jgi:hypothetical protein
MAMLGLDNIDSVTGSIVRPRARAAAAALLIAVFATIPSRPGGAYYDATKNYVESPAVAARFPDPVTPIATPALRANRRYFTDYAEMMKFLDELAARAADMRVQVAGQSQEDRAIPLLIFAHPPTRSAADLAANGKPTVLVIGQQHGNEPGGGEAALALALQLAGERRAVLDRVNVLIVPRANPDGAQNYTRGTVNGFDVNRDHLLQWTPEGRTLGRIFAAYQPAVVIDSHEFGVKTRWFEKFGAVQRYDVLIQYATVPNLSPAIAEASERMFRVPLARALDAAGFAHSWYFATSYDMDDRKVSMGGVAPDTGRNIAGLRNAISFLVETRGVGLGLAHMRRRVESHLVANNAIIDITARNAAAILALEKHARDDVVAAAGKGEFVVAGAATPGRNTLVMLDPETGTDKPVEVDWSNSLEIRPTLVRMRPYGYLLPASQAAAADRLRNLGATVLRVDSDGTADVERFRIAGAVVAKKDDVRRNDEDNAIKVVNLTTVIEKTTLPVRAGDLYVPLDQPLGNVIAAALEPDTQSSYAANYAITFPGPRDPDRYVRVYRVVSPLRTPTAPWSGP